jgi:4-coumarate--CoA ligase
MKPQKSPMLDGYDVSSVLGGTSGGAPLGVSIIEDVYKRLGFLIKMGYGLSETASTTLIPANDWEEYKQYLNGSGQPLPSVELKIIDVGGDGKTLNTDERGEILIRSPSLMNGYLGNEQATKESLDEENWFHTGDVGYLDKQGNLYIVDRLKECVSSFQSLTLWSR